MYRATGNGTVDIGGTAYPAADEDLAFGAHLPPGADPGNLPIPVPGQLGTCEEPVDFSAHRDAINRFHRARVAAQGVTRSVPLGGR